MSNYPPGVTGNEYAIAGPDYEAEEDRDCAEECAEFVSLTHVDAFLGDLARRLLEAAAHGAQGSSFEAAMKSGADGVKVALGELKALAVDKPCEFSGEVMVTGYGGQRWWTCPSCGSETTEDAAEMEDPRADDAWDDRD